MSAKHTPGNWRYEAETKTIRSVPTNYWLATMDSWDGAIDNAANAARIVACVNACERIEHPESLRENLDELGRRFNAAKTERDNLRAEVKLLREALAAFINLREAIRTVEISVESFNQLPTDEADKAIRAALQAAA